MTTFTQRVRRSRREAWRRAVHTWSWGFVFGVPAGAMLADLWPTLRAFAVGLWG